MTCVAPVCGWFTEGFDTGDLKDTKALLDDVGRLPQTAKLCFSGLMSARPIHGSDRTVGRVSTL
jgi:hypothetical protein